MNFIKRRSGSAQSPGTANDVSPERIHLGRLFSQYKQIPDANEQDRMLYELLPIFYGVLIDCKPMLFLEYFPDVHAFCSRATQLFVRDIKNMAANRTSEEGSLNIVKYLKRTHLIEDQPDEDTTSLNVDDKGWNLLSCLNLLSTGHMSLIECMVAASLPSTLVKCIYIFLDLPLTDATINPPTFYSIFKQLLQRLCIHSIATEELVRKDALCHLFTAPADFCQPHNAFWRSATSSILSTIAQNGLNALVVKYIYEAKCIPEYLKLLALEHLTPTDSVDSFVSILHVVRESTVVSFCLLDHFRVHRGYFAASELLLKLEQLTDVELRRESMGRIIALIERLVVLGPVELRPKSGAGEHIHTLPGFRVRMPKTAEKKSVRNLYAFDVLQSALLSASSTELCLLSLGSIQTIYLQDYSNYFILEPQNTLVLFSKSIYDKPNEIQVIYFNLVETLVSKLDYVPMKEVSSIIMLLKSCSFNTSMLNTLQHFNRLLTVTNVFKDVYHDIGLVELSVDLLQTFAGLITANNNISEPGLLTNSAHNSSDSCIYDIGLVLVNLIGSTISANTTNTELCIRLGITDILIDRLLSHRFGNKGKSVYRNCFIILEELTLSNGGEDLMPLLLAKMHTAAVGLKIDFLRSLCRCLQDSHRCRMVFRKVNGFVYVLQELVNLENCLSSYNETDGKTTETYRVLENQGLTANGTVMKQASRAEFLAQLTYEHIFKLIRAIFTTLGIAMKFEPSNAYYFCMEIQYANLVKAVLALGCFSTASNDRVPNHCLPSSQHAAKQFAVLFLHSRRTESAVIRAVQAAPVEQNPGGILKFELGTTALRPASGRQMSVPIKDFQLPKRLVECCLLARMVHNLVVDTYDHHSLTRSTRPADHELGKYEPNKIVPYIVHPSGILSYLKLISVLDNASGCNSGCSFTTDLQLTLLDSLNDLFLRERNQQVMSSALMAQDLLHLFPHHLTNVSSPLHDRIQGLLECLLTQRVNPSELRQFLRMSGPLRCASTKFLTSSEISSLEQPLDEIRLALAHARESCGGPLPLYQIKSLISTALPNSAQIIRPLMTPKKSRSSLCSPDETRDLVVNCALVPPFVEFDMVPEGFGCLFLPSISPQSTSSTAAAVMSTLPSNDLPGGGLGAGERPFPPQYGLTFSTWVCVMHFDDPANYPYESAEGVRQTSTKHKSKHRLVEPQAVRLLTLFRSIQGANNQVICLRIYIHAKTRKLVVCTREFLTNSDKDNYTDPMCMPLSVQQPDNENNPTISDTDSAMGSSSVVFPCGLPTSVESTAWPVGVWRHLAVVLSRAGLVKSASCTLYLDGQLVGSQKLNYLGSSVTNSRFSSVCAFVGTPTSQRRSSTLVWRQGPLHLIEEPLSANRIACIARLGTCYAGNFQSPLPYTYLSKSTEFYRPLFAEEKLMFSIYASAMSTMTLAQMRKIYAEADVVAISRQFFITSKDNITPIRCIRNSALHLAGPARTLGAVLVGYQGIRAFSPDPISRQLHYVGGGLGGVRLGLSLLAMSRDTESLYASTKAACTLIKCNPDAISEMCRMKGFRLFSMLLRQKRQFFTTRILDSVLNLVLNVGAWLESIDSTSTLLTTLSHPIFEDLLCDLDLWRVECEHTEIKSALACKLPIQDDYRLVVNLLHQLVEIFALPVSQQKHRVSNTDTGDPNETRTKYNYHHPLWNHVFERLIHLLLTAHTPRVRTQSADSSLPNEPIVLSVVGLNSLVGATMKYFKLYLTRFAPIRSVLRIGQLMSWTLLYEGSVGYEKNIRLEESGPSDVFQNLSSVGLRKQLITLRNKCFEMLIQISTDSTVSMCYSPANVILEALGFDWFYTFLQPQIHPSSVILTFRLLLLVILNPAFSVSMSSPKEDWSNILGLPRSEIKSQSPENTNLNPTPEHNTVLRHNNGLNAFRSGSPAGRWLNGCEQVLKSQQSGLLLDGSKSVVNSSNTFSLSIIEREFRLATCQQPGFTALRILLSHHYDVPELFYLLTALLLQIPAQNIPPDQNDWSPFQWMHALELEFETFYSLIEHKKSSIVSDLAAQNMGEPTLNSRSSATQVTGSSAVSGSVGGLMSSLLTGASHAMSGLAKRRHHASADGSEVTASEAFANDRSNVCQEAAFLLLHLLQLAFSKQTSESTVHADDQSENIDYCDTPLQFLYFLYRLKPSFRPVALSSEFIGGLIGILHVTLVPQMPVSESDSIRSRTSNDLVLSASKTALEFIKTIVMDSFSLSPLEHKPLHIIDIMLDTWSEQWDWKHHNDVLTRILCDLMEYIEKIDLLTDPTIHVPTGGEVKFIRSNLAYFCARMVDKLWQGHFTSDPVKIASFLIHLIEQWLAEEVEQQEHDTCSQDQDIHSIFRSLNRTLFYQLSRPMLTRADQEQTLNLFQHLKGTIAKENDYIDDLNLPNGVADSFGLYHSTYPLFSPVNADPELPPCLIHLLMQILISKGKYLESFLRTRIMGSSDRASNAQDLSDQKLLSSKTKEYNSAYYHTAFYDDEFTGDGENSASVAKSHSGTSSQLCDDTLDEVTKHLVESTLNIWTECYRSRKSMIAQLAPDTPLVSGLSVPSLIDWSPILESPCLMIWAQYMDSEAAGSGGVNNSTQWGCLPGPPVHMIDGLATTADPLASSSGPVKSESIPPIHPSAYNSTGLYQISAKLSRLPSHMFRLGPTASSSTDNQPTPNIHSSSCSQILRMSPDVLLNISCLKSGNIRAEMEASFPIRLAHLHDFMEQQRKEHDRNFGFMQRQLMLEWEQIEVELIRERGLWGRLERDSLTRWMLDPTEGPCRMRKRMVQNPSFYSRYPYDPFGYKKSHAGTQPTSIAHSPTPFNLKVRRPRSNYSQMHFFNFQPKNILHDDWGPLTPWIHFSEDHQRLPAESTQLKGDEAASSLPDETEMVDETNDADVLERSLRDTETLLRLSDQLSPHKRTKDATDDDDQEESGQFIDRPDFSEPESNSASPPESSPGPPSAIDAETMGTDPQVTPSLVGSSLFSSVVENETDPVSNHEAILQLLEPGEHPTVMYRCARVLGLEVFEGLLLFGRHHFYVIDGYTLINTHEIMDIDALPVTINHEPIVPCMCSHSEKRSSYLTDVWNTGTVSQSSGKQYFKFPYERIEDVHKRRYLLQPIAVEVFNADGRNFLLVFSKGLQSKVFHRFKDVINSDSPQHSIISKKTTSSILGSLLGEKTVTQRWERGELTNFEYLMYLNTQAGRSYNDLMQYPVFPWVLADYDSEELNLTRPETFRLFSKPMGAQATRRFSQFERRFKEWEDPTGETPPYHYGTHYSSAMIVASYLVRMEPFTQQFLKLQGGHFDLPDRMFHCLKDTWISASQHNMADVRELIPEFYYLPDFLINSNRFELGVKQNGQPVNDVVLPPWAKGDAREFIRAHREALESEYVSAHLHEWIDLIFGHKQSGDAAVQAGNVFHHLFYEGNVDIYSINDPLKRSAVIGFINNFGQIPKQLFRKPHPGRRIAVPRVPTALLTAGGNQTANSQLAVDLFYRNIPCLMPHLYPIKELKHAVGQIMQVDPALVPSGFTSAVSSSAAMVPTNVVADNKTNGNLDIQAPLSSPLSASTPQIGGGVVVAVEENKCLLPPNHNVYISWGFGDHSMRLAKVFDPSERIRCVFELPDTDEVLCCAAPNWRTLITAGVSSMVRVWKIETVDLTSHNRPSGSNASHRESSTNSTTTSTSGTSSTTYRLNPLADLCGHTDAITCLATSDAFNLVVSGSRDRTCIVWDLGRLRYLNQLPDHVAPVAAVFISDATGDITSCAGSWLYLWDSNGQLISCVDTMTARNGQIYCVCMSTMYPWDADNVIITGGSDGIVRMWSLQYSSASAPKIQNATETSNELAADGKLVSPATTHPKEPVWERKLILRGKLTMHTAYDRADNRQPAAITALAIARDHRSVLVGDYRGRVHAWTVPTETARGGITDQWVRDEGATKCAADGCTTRFSLTERRHHCRNCGKVFCSKCSRFEIEIYHLRLFKRVRVCQTCHEMLEVMQAPLLTTLTEKESS